MPWAGCPDCEGYGWFTRSGSTGGSEPEPCYYQVPCEPCWWSSTEEEREAVVTDAEAKSAQYDLVSADFGRLRGLGRIRALA